jgi:leader peptidase (prepilin peptidase) / N-methyltransferase
MIGLLVGAALGSHAGVALTRWRDGGSAHRPVRSSCPACGTRLRARDLVPIVSWIALRGRCRTCAVPIDRRLLVIEVACTVLGGVAAWTQAPLLHAAIATVVGCAVVLATATDLERRVIPDRLSIPLALFVVPVVLLDALLVGQGRSAVRSAEPLLAFSPILLVPAGLVAINVASRRAAGIGAIGGGDIKLLIGVTAATVLVPNGLRSFWAAVAVCGGTFALAGLLTGRLRPGDHLPFAPIPARRLRGRPAASRHPIGARRSAMRTRRRRRVVDVHLGATSATVVGRRGRRRVVEQHRIGIGGDGEGEGEGEGEGAAESSAGLLLRSALRASRLLRPGSPCDLRIVWDPQRLLLRLERPQGVSSSAAGAEVGQVLEKLAPGSIVAFVPLPPGQDVHLSVMVPSAEVDRIAVALRSSRVVGHARLDVGVLSRARAVLERVAADVEGRPGFIVDVSPSNVVLLGLQGTEVTALRSSPRSRPAAQVGRMLTELVIDAARTPSRPWLCIHSADEELADVRAACRAALPPGVVVDLLRRPLPLGAAVLSGSSSQGGR